MSISAAPILPPDGVVTGHPHKSAPRPDRQPSAGRRVNSIGRSDGGPKGDLSSEEKRVQSTSSFSLEVSGQNSSATGASSDSRGFLPSTWPAALKWEDALAYCALSPTQLRRLERDGAIKFLNIGPHGSKVAIRQDLDRLLSTLFAPAPSVIAEDFDFG